MGLFDGGLSEAERGTHYEEDGLATLCELDGKRAGRGRLACRPKCL